MPWATPRQRRPTATTARSASSPATSGARGRGARPRDIALRRRPRARLRVRARRPRGCRPDGLRRDAAGGRRRPARGLGARSPAGRLPRAVCDRRGRRGPHRRRARRPARRGARGRAERGRRDVTSSTGSACRATRDGARTAAGRLTGPHRPGGAVVAPDVGPPHRLVDVILRGYGRLPAATRAAHPLVLGGESFGDRARMRRAARDADVRVRLASAVPGVLDGASAAVFGGPYDPFVPGAPEAALRGVPIVAAVGNAAADLAQSAALVYDGRDVERSPARSKRPSRGARRGARRPAGRRLGRAAGRLACGRGCASARELTRERVALGAGRRVAERRVVAERVDLALDVGGAADRAVPRGVGDALAGRAENGREADPHPVAADVSSRSRRTARRAAAAQAERRGAGGPRRAQRRRTPAGGTGRRAQVHRLDLAVDREDRARLDDAAEADRGRREEATVDGRVGPRRLELHRLAGQVLDALARAPSRTGAACACVRAPRRGRRCRRGPCTCRAATSGGRRRGRPPRRPCAGTSPCSLERRPLRADGQHGVERAGDEQPAADAGVVEPAEDAADERGVRAVAVRAGGAEAHHAGAPRRPVPRVHRAREQGGLLHPLGIVEAYLADEVRPVVGLVGEQGVPCALQTRHGLDRTPGRGCGAGDG